MPNHVCEQTGGHYGAPEHIDDQLRPMPPQIQEGSQGCQHGKCTAVWSNHRRHASRYARDQRPPQPALRMLDVAECGPRGHHREQCREPVMIDLRPDSLRHHHPARREKGGEWRVLRCQPASEVRETGDPDDSQDRQRPYGPNRDSGNAKPCVGEKKTAGRQKFKEISVKTTAPQHAFSAVQQYTLIAYPNDANERQAQHGGN